MKNAVRKTYARKFRIFFGMGIVFWFFSASVSGSDLHESGLAAGMGLDLVLANCTVCHSADIIVQNRMSRSDWDRTISWMQKEQGLWELAPEDRNGILDYLAEYQGASTPVAKIKPNERKNKMYQYDYRPNPLYNY